MPHAKTIKRLDGKKKLISLTAEQEKDIRFFCQQHGIESESELIRQAIVSYIGNDHNDNTLKLSGLKDIREKLAQNYDLLSLLFNYVHLMHLNILAYFPEIPESLKEAAYTSAELRQERFFYSFRERLKDDTPFFEKLLHNYVSGTLDE